MGSNLKELAPLYVFANGRIARIAQYCLAHAEASLFADYHCKKGKVVLNLVTSVLLIVCIVKHSGVPLPALDSKQIKNLI